MEQSPSSELIVAQLVRKFLSFYGPRNFIRVFKRDHHWAPTLSQFNSVHALTRRNLCPLQSPLRSTEKHSPLQV
jgi:hypothetical protein